MKQIILASLAFTALALIGCSERSTMPNVPSAQLNSIEPEASIGTVTKQGAQITVLDHDAMTGSFVDEKENLIEFYATEGTTIYRNGERCKFFSLQVGDKIAIKLTKKSYATVIDAEGTYVQ
jgi:hypothetical protein